MLTPMGAPGVVLASDRDVPCSTIENVPHAQGFSDGYTIHIRPCRDQLMILIQVSVPVSGVPAEGVPEVPAEQVLRVLTAAVEEIDRVSAE